MKVKFISKKKLYPAFGEVDMKKQVAYVRSDLPLIVKKFVMEHEIYHLKDKSKNWIWRELKANFFAGIKNPLGLLVTIFMSLAYYRLKFYLNRIKEKE